MTTREPGDLPTAVVFRLAGVCHANGFSPRGDKFGLRFTTQVGRHSKGRTMLTNLNLSPLRKQEPFVQQCWSARAARWIPAFAGMTSMFVAVESLAQTAPRPDVVGANIEEIVVSATRSPQSLSKIGSSVTVIDQALIVNRQATVVSDLISLTPGVTTTRNGGVGAATSVRIRGAETDQTVVIIDGVKLNDPSSVGGGYNFGNLLAGDVARIEVLRGAQSTLWGGQAIGGVINLISAAATRPFEGSASVEGGSHGSFAAKAATGGALYMADWRLAAGRSVTDGISAFENGRERDGYKNTGLSGRVRLGLSDDVGVDARAVYSRGRTEFDGFPPPTFALADTRQFGFTRDFVGYAGLTADTFGGRWKNRIAYTLTDTNRDDFNPDQATTTRTFDGVGRNHRGEYQGTVALSELATAVFGIEHERSSQRTASPSSFAPNPVPLDRHVSMMSGYAQANGDVAEGLSLTAGARYDDHQTFGGHAVGQASAAWTPNAGVTIVRASFGQGFKAPTLFQLYSAFGNTALDPESADSWDAGVETRVGEGGVTIGATMFGRRTKNQIDFVSCPNPSPLCTGRFGFYENVARTKAFGVEASAAAIVDRFSMDANYTLTDTENTSPGSPNRGKDLARRPRHAGNLNIDYAWPMGGKAGGGVRYVGKSFDNAANSFVLDDYIVLDVRASFEIREGVELYGRVENLLDERYSNARGYGQPGRGAFAGLRTKF